MVLWLVVFCLAFGGMIDITFLNMNVLSILEITKRNYNDDFCCPLHHTAMPSCSLPTVNNAVREFGKRTLKLGRGYVIATRFVWTRRPLRALHKCFHKLQPDGVEIG